MNKKALTEADIRTKYITPAIVGANGDKWDVMTQVSEEALLQKYADSGIASVESLEILKVDPLRAFGTPVEIVKLFGGRDNYLAAIRELETALYQKVA